MEQEARGVKAKTIVRGTPYELAGTGDGYWEWSRGHGKGAGKWGLLGQGSGCGRCCGAEKGDGDGGKKEERNEGMNIGDRQRGLPSASLIVPRGVISVTSTGAATGLALGAAMAGRAKARVMVRAVMVVNCILRGVDDGAVCAVEVVDLVDGDDGRLEVCCVCLVDWRRES